MDINAKGVFLGTKYAIAEMRKSGGGSIVNISSVVGLIGTRDSAPYGASKGGGASTYQVRCNPVHQRERQLHPPRWDRDTDDRSLGPSPIKIGRR